MQAQLAASLVLESMVQSKILKRLDAATSWHPSKGVSDPSSSLALCATKGAAPSKAARRQGTTARKQEIKVMLMLNAALLHVPAQQWCRAKL